MSGPDDRIVRVTAPVQVVRSAGQPKVARVQQPTVQVVRAGMPGRDGTAVAAASVSFIHQQSAPAPVWEFDHPLGRPPQITVTDTAGNVWYGDIRHLSSIRVQIQFGFPFAGQAVCT